MQGISVNTGIKAIEDLPEGKCMILTLCRHLGDDKFEYDPKDKKSLEAASKKLEAAQKGERRMVPIAVGGDREKPEVVSKLDPKAKGHVLTTPISGG
jgi:hypothetical protein